MDEDTRECLSLHVERRINARKVRQIMAGLIQEDGTPVDLRSPCAPALTYATN
jgi:hypothetical protein